MKPRTTVLTSWVVLTVLIVLHYVELEHSRFWHHFGGYWKHCWLELPFGLRWRGGSWMVVTPAIWAILAKLARRRADTSSFVAPAYMLSAWLAYAATVYALNNMIGGGIVGGGGDSSSQSPPTLSQLTRQAELIVNGNLQRVRDDQGLGVAEISVGDVHKGSWTNLRVTVIDKAFLSSGGHYYTDISRYQRYLFFLVSRSNQTDHSSTYQLSDAHWGIVPFNISIAREIEEASRDAQPEPDGDGKPAP